MLSSTKTKFLQNTPDTFYIGSSVSKMKPRIISAIAITGEEPNMTPKKEKSVKAQMDIKQAYAPICFSPLHSAT